MDAEERFENFEDFLKHIYIELRDGTTYLAPVISSADAGSFWVFTLGDEASGVDISAEDIKFVTWAMKARLLQDSHKETWHTTEVMEVEFSAIELLAEDDIEAGAIEPGALPTPELVERTVIPVSVGHAVLIGMDPEVTAPGEYPID